MMNKLALIATCALFSSVTMAQEKSTEQEIFYKWYVNGIAHYAKTPPRETQNYVRINQFGMLMKDRPNVDSFQVIKPLRPNMGEMNTNETVNAEQSDSAEMPEGTISKNKRCNMMREELTALETKEDIYQEDESGNLIPLDDEAIEARKQDMRETIERVCEN